jgi:hypothetical protein
MKAESCVQNRTLVEHSQQMLNDGRYIEAGWDGFQISHLSQMQDFSPRMVELVRQAFFFGAQHLNSITSPVMLADGEPTIDQLARLYLVGDEMDVFERSQEIQTLCMTVCGGGS